MLISLSTTLHLSASSRRAVSRLNQLAPPVMNATGIFPPFLSASVTRHKLGAYFQSVSVSGLQDVLHTVDNRFRRRIKFCDELIQFVVEDRIDINVELVGLG